MRSGSARRSFGRGDQGRRTSIAVLRTTSPLTPSIMNSCRNARNGHPESVKWRYRMLSCVLQGAVNSRCVRPLSNPVHLKCHSDAPVGLRSGMFGVRGGGNGTGWQENPHATAHVTTAPAGSASESLSAHTLARDRRTREAYRAGPARGRPPASSPTPHASITPAATPHAYTCGAVIRRTTCACWARAHHRAISLGSFPG